MGLYKQKFNPRTGQFNLVPSNLVITFKESVPTFADLPLVGNTQNDARITDDTGHLYVWDGSTWIDQGDIIDLKWAAIEDKPSSPVADIDDAVAKRHTQDTDKYLTTQLSKYTRYVDCNRTDVYVEDGSLTKPYKTIQAAINAVFPVGTEYYTIAIMPGTYMENIVLKPGVNLKGYGNDITGVMLLAAAGDNITGVDLGFSFIQGVLLVNFGTGYHLNLSAPTAFTQMDMFRSTIYFAGGTSKGIKLDKSTLTIGSSVITSGGTTVEMSNNSTLNLNQAGLTSITGNTIELTNSNLVITDGGLTANAENCIVAINSNINLFNVYQLYSPTAGKKNINADATSTVYWGIVNCDPSKLVYTNRVAIYSELLTNKLGIGTATPATPLDVVGIIRSSYLGYEIYHPGIPDIIAKLYRTDTAEITLSACRDYSGNKLILKALGNIEILSGTNSGNPGATIFKSDDVERMRLTTDGKLGIGTNTPTEKLHVVGNILLDNENSLQGRTNPYTGNISLIKLNSINRICIGQSANCASTQIFYGNTDSNIIASFGGGAGQYAGVGKLAQDANETLRITQVLAADAILRIYDYSRTLIYMFMDKDGKVGIGTDTPLYKLHINSLTEGLLIAVPSGYVALGIGGTGKINVDAPGITAGRFTILENGKVGIGTATPNEILHIVGNLKIEQIAGVGGWDFVTGNPGNGIPSLISATNIQIQGTTVRLAAGNLANYLELNSTGDVTITGELKIKVYSQDAEPTLGADNFMAMWIDTDDSNRVYILFRRGTGDQTAVELT